MPPELCFEISAHDGTDDVERMEALARALSFPDYFGATLHERGRLER